MKKLTIVILAIMFIILIGFSIKQGKNKSSNQNVNTNQLPAIVSQNIDANNGNIINNKNLSVDEIVQLMIDNPTISQLLSSLCHRNEVDCPANVFYQWKTIAQYKSDICLPDTTYCFNEWNDDENAYLIAFLSDLEDNEEKNDPFHYAHEVYKVNIDNGEVLKQSGFDGSFSYLLNIFN